MDSKLIYQHLIDYSDHFKIKIFHKIDSTNRFLLDHHLHCINNKKFPVIVTEIQTEGRGRNKNIWYSFPLGSLTFSTTWDFDAGFKHLSGLSLVISLSLLRAFKKLSFADIKLKWPNDILYKSKKLAGILVECRMNDVNSYNVVIGIGINIKLAPCFYNQFNKPATDLYRVSGRTIDRNQLLATILIENYQVLKTFELNGFSSFKTEWISNHHFHNKKVVLHMPNQRSIEGWVTDITDNGELVLKTEKGTEFFSVGELSLLTQY